MAVIAGALEGLDNDERLLVVNFVQQLAEMLRTRHRSKSTRRK
ncbi:hypothetical protein C7405_10659 [Paraburkholderia caballeronis]|nr:hypothetical protein C7405_10659 [Paraburkholderia caballeronis]